MKRINLIANETTYASLKTFNEIEELNKTVRKYKDMINNMPLRQDLKKNLLILIDRLKRYSCKFFGVSWQGKRKIADDLKMSDKTVTRLCKRLEELGFIKQYPMKRPNSIYQTVNAITIQPLQVERKEENVRLDGVGNAVKSTSQNEKMSELKTNTSFKTNTYNKNLRTGSVSDNLVAKIIPSWVNPEFAKFALNFYSPKEVIEFARIALINGKQYLLETKEVAAIAMDSFKQLIFKVKQGTQTVRNPFGMFTSIIRQKLRTEHVRGLFNDVFNLQNS